MTAIDARSWHGYLPCSREELELVLRGIVAAGVEGAKVDFKTKLNLETPADRAKFAQIVGAIANTDDAAHDDWGFLIVGAERGSLVGGADEFNPDSQEQLSTRLEDQLRKYLIPPPRVGVVGYRDPDLGCWGAIVIRPSAEQPHLILREHAQETAAHECWVRVGSSTQRAGAHDFSRLFEKRVRRATRELERELGGLHARVRELETSRLPVAIVDAEAAAPKLPSTTTERLHVLLRSPERDLADLLLSEARALYAVMAQETDALPWSFDGARTQKETCQSALTTLESAARPLVEAVALVLDRSVDDQHTSAIADALRVVAREPAAPGTYVPELADVRSYPVSLAVYAVATVAAVAGRGRTLRQILELEFETRYSERPTCNLACVPRRMAAVENLFRLVAGENRTHAASSRTVDALSRWLNPFVRGCNARDAVAVGEFVVALAFLVYGDEGGPLPASYLYLADADRAIRRFLRSRPPVLVELFENRVEEVLARFDSTARSMTQPSIMGRGFQGGAVAAWKGEPTR